MPCEDFKIKCPKCSSNKLVYYVKTEGVRGHKINKDGSLSKQTLRSFGQPTDIYFLHCDKCGFEYNLSHPSMNKENYSDLEDWYDEFGKVIE